MLKRLIPKHQSGSFLSLTSSPAATIYGYSAAQQPNYNLALYQDTSDLATRAVPNYAQEFKNFATPIQNQTKSSTELMNRTYGSQWDQLTSATIEPTSVTPTVSIDSLNEDLQSFSKSLPEGKVSFSDKFNNSTFGKNSGTWGAALNTANDAFTAAAGGKSEYSGDKGAITKGLDTAYDAISDAIAVVPGWGTIASLAMKANKLVGNVVNKLGGGTDGMCVCAGTKVFTANGDIINIEDLKPEDGIIGWNENTKEIRPQIVSHIIEPRQKECVRIELQNGIVLDCSFDHPIYILTSQGWKFVQANNLHSNLIVGTISNITKELEQVPIKSIIPIGVQTVYNLQADNDHTYLANGIITHNTTADAILGSSFMQMTPMGMINGFGGKKAETITKNEQAFETVGSSYSGTSSTVDDALTKSGKKYGLLSNKARQKANSEITEAKRQQNVMSDIADTATNRFNIQQSTAAINENRRAFALQGGYSQANVRVGKSGMSLELMQQVKQILKSPKKQTSYEVTKITPINLFNNTQQFKNGGNINKFTEIIPIEETNIEFFQKGGKTNKKSRTLEELIEYAKKENPRFIQRMSEPVRDIEFIDNEGNKARGTHYMTWSTDDNGNAIVYAEIMEDDDGNLKHYGKDAYRRAIDKNDFLIMTPEEAELFTISDEDENGNLYGYKKGWSGFFKSKKFQEGGSINVIPEGALHARKHHMDVDGITKKGIPVVDNNGEQQAEIERSEVILRLEVTKELERLYKIYYNESSSQKEKEKAALEAGQMLTNELLNNTVDNTQELL